MEERERLVVVLEDLIALAELREPGSLYERVLGLRSLVAEYRAAHLGHSAGTQGAVPSSASVTATEDLVEALSLLREVDGVISQSAWDLGRARTWRAHFARLRSRLSWLDWGEAELAKELAPWPEQRAFGGLFVCDGCSAARPDERPPGAPEGWLLLDLGTETELVVRLATACSIRCLFVVVDRQIKDEQERRAGKGVD